MKYCKGAKVSLSVGLLACAFRTGATQYFDQKMADFAPRENKGYLTVIVLKVWL